MLDSEQRSKIYRATPRYILCILRPVQVHKTKKSIRIHHFIFPWWKIGISLRKRSIRTINITRRRRSSPTRRKAPQTMCRSLQTKNIHATLNWIISYQVTYSYAWCKFFFFFFWESFNLWRPLLIIQVNCIAFHQNKCCNFKLNNNISQVHSNLIWLHKSKLTRA